MSLWSDILNWFRPKPKPPVPPIPPTPPTVNVVRVFIDDGITRLTPTDGSLLLDWNGQTLNGSINGQALWFTLPAGAPMGWGALLHTTVTGFQDFNNRIVLAPDINVTVRKTVTLKPLIVDGGFFRTADGPHTVIQTSAFKDLARLIEEGADALRPVLQQARDLGFNDRRVFSTCKNLFHLEPSPAYWSNAHRLCELAAEYNQRITMVVLVDVRALGWSRQQQQDHWIEWGGVALQHPNIRLSLVNEVDQSPNLLDLNDFQPIPGVLCSHGSHGGTNGGVPGQPFGCGVRPWWDWEECHSNGQKKAEKEEQRVPAHLCKEITDGEGDTLASHRPAECSEMSRFPDQWGGYGNLEDVAFAIGQSTALLGAGGCVHTLEGRTSQLFVAALPYVRKFCEGARSVPLRFQKGRYNRPDDPNFLRVYERILGAESFVSKIPKAA